MSDRQVAPYGSWKSPITADAIIAGSVQLSDIDIDGEITYWLEGRPAEAGRTVLVARGADGQNVDVTPRPFNVRTRVHEYGGGAYLVDDGEIVFSHFADNRLYLIRAGEAPRPVTPQAPLRYADGVMDRVRNRTIWVREDHSNSEREAVNTIVAVPLDGGEQETLVAGNDFYAAPRLSPDGTRLAWLTWNHPNMPWDGTELWVAEVVPSGALDNARQVAGGQEESILQPCWSPSGDLYCVSDRTGWWNLYRVDGTALVPLAPDEAEYARPPWVFGESSYGFSADNEILAVRSAQGQSSLCSILLSGGSPQRIETPYTVLAGLTVGSGQAVFVGASPVESAALVSLDLKSHNSEVLKRSSALDLPADFISAGEPVEFPTDGGVTSHAFYYAPRNPEFAAPDGELPPLIVKSHGGPTSFSPNQLSPSIQFWTSRGFAVLDVNYGGSTGYGRDYRQRLNGRWGIVDVADCVNGALAMVQAGKADPDRLIITGGSAGGYTTLNALTFRDEFKAGASYFGIGDLEPFAQDTHKYESRYLDSLIGPYPEHIERYRERSAVNYTDRLSAPMILFQGADDRVVPPNQAELMAAALDRKGLPYAHIVYEGEGHGFRQAKNIKHSLESELYFYSRVFGFPIADEVEPVPVAHLP